MSHIDDDLKGSAKAINMWHRVFLDYDFVSIVSGIAEGRLIFVLSNFKKNIRYTMTHILPEVTAS